MAIDVKNKKTSLDEEAAIYEKRDEEEKWKKQMEKDEPQPEDHAV